MEDVLSIRVENAWSYVSKETPKHFLKWLHKLLSVELSDVVNGEYVVWERHLFSLKTYKYPSGMNSFVADNSVKDHINILWDNRRAPISENVVIYDLPEKFSYLNKHQKDAFELMRTNPQGILKHATGSGKTDLAIAFAYCVQGNVLFLADEKTLLYQAKERWESKTGSKAGIIGDGKYDVRRFTVASFDSIMAKKDMLEMQAYLNSVSCLFVDECHVAGAKTYWSTIMSIPAYWRYGLSATPFGRSDGMDPYVCAAIGPIIHEVKMEDLYSVRLVPPKVIFYEYPVVTEHWGGWIDLIKKNKDRMKAIVDLFRIVPYPCLTFFQWIDHGQLLLKLAENAHINARLVSGDNSAQQRKQAIKMLNDGEIDLLIASSIFNKGTDIPNVRSCINAAGMKAVIPSIQKLGRGLRLVEGKDSLIFLDLVDTGYVTNREHSRERYATYKKEGLDLYLCKDLKEIQNIIGMEKKSQATSEKSVESCGNHTLKIKDTEYPTNTGYMSGLLSRGILRPS